MNMSFQFSPRKLVPLKYSHPKYILERVLVFQSNISSLNIQFDLDLIFNLHSAQLLEKHFKLSFNTLYIGICWRDHLDPPKVYYYLLYLCFDLSFMKDACMY